MDSFLKSRVDFRAGSQGGAQSFKWGSFKRGVSAMSLTHGQSAANSFSQLELTKNDLTAASSGGGGEGGGGEVSRATLLKERESERQVLMQRCPPPARSCLSWSTAPPAGSCLSERDWYFIEVL